MGDRILIKWGVAVAAAIILPLGSLRAQEGPKPDESFEVEPPLLVPPGDSKESADETSEAQPDAAQLARQLDRAQKSAASAERLVKIGVLAEVEAEQRAMRVVRLEAEVAKAQMVAAQAEVTLQRTRQAAGQTSQADLDAALATLTRASAVAQTAEESYRKAQLDAAALNLRRQKRLLAQGSARKSDVARAEEKLAALQRGEQPPR